jgi:hypothetical protein
MFYNTQSKDSKDRYIEALTIIGSLSNLFSNSKVPYLYYRIAEKVFCDAFNTLDLSRGDIALDTAKEKIGIGLKTFLKNNNKTLQKVAEFNKDREIYAYSNDLDIIKTISNLRNERIVFAENLSNVDSSIYHCVVRSEDKFLLYEEEMSLININEINHIKRTRNSIYFDDGIHEYSFNLSKSTLLKRFYTNSVLKEFEIKIFDNPLDEIKNCLSTKTILSSQNNIIETIYLPLYGKNKVVSQKSGLNQWNASGRDRDSNEIYIPIPAKIHHHSPSFFPSRDVPFTLHLPNGKYLTAKVCQDNSKALMSNPNKALGKWLLRDVLNLKEDELLTYKKLQTLGIDCVKIDKVDNENFYINFSSLDGYEEYIEHTLLEAE